MQAAPSAAPPKGGLKKKPPTKPDPTAAITVGMAAASLKQPVFKRFSLSIEFPVLISPTTYFGSDGRKRVCVDFHTITQHFDNYKTEVSGKTLKLYMKLHKSFFSTKRVNNEIAMTQADRDTIISAQTETSSLVYGQCGDEENIWSLPQIVVLPFEVESEAYFKPIFSDGCDKLYTKLSAESEANGGSFPDNAVHQMYTFLRFIAIGTEKAIKGSNKINEQVNISPNRR